MDELTTRTDDIPDSFVTPTPTITPTSVITPTSTPTSHPDGVDLILNATEFYSGDSFKLHAACYGPVEREVRVHYSKSSNDLS